MVRYLISGCLRQNFQKFYKLNIEKLRLRVLKIRYKKLITIETSRRHINIKMMARRKRSHKLQIEFLCKYMQQHQDFANGDNKTPHGVAQIERQWVQLQAALDELGPHRTVEQWKICWRDQKRKAKLKGSVLNKIITSSDDHGAIPDLSESGCASAIILDTNGKEMALGCSPAESPRFLPPAAPAPAAPLAAYTAPTFPPVTCIIASNSRLPSTSAPPFTIPLPLSSVFIPSPPPSSTTTIEPPSLPLNDTSSPAPTTKRHVRASHTRNRFLNAQKELKGLIRELTKEVRRSNYLKEEQNRLLKKFCRRRQ